MHEQDTLQKASTSNGSLSLSLASIVGSIGSLATLRALLLHSLLEMKLTRFDEDEMMAFLNIIGKVWSMVTGISSNVSDSLPDATCITTWIYVHYWSYCTARLKRLYESLKFTHGSDKYTRNAISNSTVTEVKFLHLVLYTVERGRA